LWTPILYHEKPDVRDDAKVPGLYELLAAGYRIKMVNDFEYDGAVYAHYVLERESE
jgi:hypothetical protein